MQLVFGIENVRPVGLLVVVVVVEVLPSIAQSVSDTGRREVLDVRVNGSDELVGAGSCTIKGTINGIRTILPNQRIECFPNLPIRVQAIVEPFHTRIALADIGVDSCAVFGPETVDLPGLISGGITSGHIFGSEKSIIAKHVSANNKIPFSKLLAMEKTNIGLLTESFPGFGLRRFRS